MKELIEHFEFKLETPIKTHLSIDGKNTIGELDTIYLKANSFKDRILLIPVKQAFLSAFTSFSMRMAKGMSEGAIARGQEAREDKEEDQTMNAATIKAILYGSGSESINLESFIDNFNKFLTSGRIAFKDADFTQPVQLLEINKLEEFDYDELVAKYIEVFMAASWVRTLS